ncbi:MAG: hypothetical protein J2P25_15030 [Nocardiopsaceae bacterium]|nr:hypothetical protein [Nocardiopsaceae bacterium]
MVAVLALLGVTAFLAACSSGSSSASSSGSASSTRSSAPTAGAPTSTASTAPTSAAPTSGGTSGLVPMQTANGGEFLSPSGNISCEVDYHRAGTTQAYCQTQSPPQSVTMTATGTYKTCNGGQCLGNVGDGTPTLAYGKATGVGPFRCESATTGITCVANGKGFQISTSGISPASSSGSPASTSDGFSKALTAWKAAAKAPEATMNTYLQQAASDLKAAGNSSYDTAISELTYLAGLPATNLTSGQQAQARADEKNLDTFFGTPGLMS